MVRAGRGCATRSGTARPRPACGRTHPGRLRRAQDIDQLAAEQKRLLTALWPLLKPGGKLVYCTCSVFRAEGEAQVRTFLAHNTTAVSLPAPGHLWPRHAGEGGPLPDNSPSD